MQLPSYACYVHMDNLGMNISLNLIAPFLWVGDGRGHQIRFYECEALADYKLGGDGNRFGEYLCVDCANLPGISVQIPLKIGQHLCPVEAVLRNKRYNLIILSS